MVKQLRLFRLGRRIIHFFSLAAADNKLGARQLPKMMRYRRAAHADHGGKVDDALLAMAKEPKKAQAAPIAQLLQKNRYGLKIFRARHALQLAFDFLAMIVRRRWVP